MFFVLIGLVMYFFLNLLLDLLKLKDDGGWDDDDFLDVWLYYERDIINEVIYDKVGVVFIEDNVREIRFIWFRNIIRREFYVSMRRCERIILRDVRRGRLKKKCREVIR